MARSAKIFLPPSPWQRFPELTFDVFLELAVVEYLNKNADEAESYFQECLLHTK